MKKIENRGALLIYLEKRECIVHIAKNNNGTSWGILIGGKMNIKDLNVIEPFVIQTELLSREEAIEVAEKELKRIIRIGKNLFTVAKGKYKIYQFMYLTDLPGSGPIKSKAEYEMRNGPVFSNSDIKRIISNLKESKEEESFEEFLKKVFSNIAEYNNLTGID